MSQHVVALSAGSSVAPAAQVMIDNRISEVGFPVGPSDLAKAWRC